MSTYDSFTLLREGCDLEGHREMKDQFEKLKLAYDILRQEAHSASLELQVKTKTNAELSIEMVEVANENDALRTKQARLCQQHDTEIKNLQGIIEQLQAEKADMQQCIEELSERLSKSKSESKIETFQTAEPCDSIQHLDQITKLDGKLKKTELKLYEMQQANAVLSDECKCLTERFESLQINYGNAKQEKEELQHLLEAAQAHASSLSAEIQELRCNPDGIRKGNSLFAEVDDQRKKLINIIKGNNAKYYSLKAEHQKCPQRNQRFQNELAQLECRLKKYEESLGCADKSYATALQQQNKHIMDELQKETDRNNFLQRELANNSDAWVRSLVKYNLEEMNGIRSRFMKCLLEQRLAEDEHLWRARELEHVRSEIMQMKLKSCYDHYNLLKSHIPPSGTQDQDANSSKVSISQKGAEPFVNSNLKLNEPECPLESAICNSIAEGGVNSEVPPAKTSIKTATTNQETSEDTPIVTKPTEHESQSGKRIELNTTAKPLVIKRIQLGSKFLDANRSNTN